MASQAISVMSELYSMLHNPFVTKMIFIVILLLLGIIIGRTAGRVALVILHEIEINRILRKAARIKADAEKGISLVIEYAIYAATIIWALNMLNITRAAFYVIAAIITAAAAVSLLLALKEFFPNAIAGMIIKRRKLISIGDKIILNNTEGKVTEMLASTTRIETKDKDVIHIPNSTLLKKKFRIIKMKRKKA